MSVTPISIKTEQDSQPRMDNKLLKDTGILLATTPTCVGSFLLADTFTAKRKFNSIIKGIEEDHKNWAKEDTIKEIGELYSNCREKIPDKIKEAIAQKNYIENLKYAKEEIEQVRKNRIKYLTKGIKIATLTGAFATLFLLFYNHYFSKNTKDKTISQNKDAFQKPTVPFKPQNMNSSFAKFNKQVVFKGILDETADKLTKEKIDKLRKYINGENQTTEELKLAKKIARLSSKKNWPKGLDKKPLSMSIFTKTPPTDRVYHSLILQTVFHIPKKPSKYLPVKNFFSINKVDIAKQWQEYIDKTSKYERMLNFVNKERMLLYGRKKMLAQKETKRQLQIALINNLLTQKFLSKLNSKENNSTLPNAIMLEGGRKADREQIINYVVKNANADYKKIKTDKKNLKDALNKIYELLEHKDKNQRLIMCVENFGNFLNPKINTEDSIADLKDLLCKLNDDYKTTLIFDTKTSKHLDPIALQAHRVNIKININTIKFSDNDLTKLKEQIQQNTKPQ